MFNSYIMSPPEVWGPAVWTLFHTLIEKMNTNAYPYVIHSTFGMIVRICRVLPCPDCSRDASKFLAKINLKDYKTKNEFKNMLYLFHNWVNAKKRKPLFNYANINKYANLHLPFVINNFIANYNTKGNMKLLTESFQRSFVVKDFISWFKTNSRVFIQPSIINILQNINQPLESKETQILTEKKLVEDIATNNVVEEHITTNNVVEEPITTDNVVEEPITNNNVVEEPITTDNVVEEHITYEEDIIQTKQILKNNFIVCHVDNEEILSNQKDNIQPDKQELNMKQISKKKRNKAKK